MFGKKKSTSKKQTDAKKSVNKKTQKAKEGESLPLTPASKLSFATPSAASNAGRNAADFLYIANEAHYDQVIERIKDVKKKLSGLARLI